MDRLQAPAQPSLLTPSYFSFPFSLAVSLPVTELTSSVSPRGAPGSRTSFASIQVIHSPTFLKPQAAMPTDPTGRYKGNNYDPLYQQKRQQRNSQFGSGSRDDLRRQHTDVIPGGHWADSRRHQYGEAIKGTGANDERGPALPGPPGFRTTAPPMPRSDAPQASRNSSITPSAGPTGLAAGGAEPVTPRKPNREREPGEIESESGSAAFPQVTSSPQSSIHPSRVVQISTPHTIAGKRPESLDLSKNAQLLNTPEKNGPDRAASMPLLSPLTDLEKLRKFKAEVEASRLRNAGKNTPSLTSMAQSFLKSQLPMGIADPGAADDSAAHRKEQELKDRLLKPRHRTSDSADGRSLHSHAAHDISPKTLKRPAEQLPYDEGDFTSKRVRLDGPARSREELSKLPDKTNVGIDDHSQHGGQDQAKVRQQDYGKSKLNLQPSATNFVPARFQKRSGVSNSGLQHEQRQSLDDRRETPPRRDVASSAHGAETRDRQLYDHGHSGQELQHPHQRVSHDGRYDPDVPPRDRAADSRMRARARSRSPERRQSFGGTDPIVPRRESAYGGDNTVNQSRYQTQRNYHRVVPYETRDTTRPTVVDVDTAANRRPANTARAPLYEGRETRTSGSRSPSSRQTTQRHSPVSDPTLNQQQVIEAISVLKAQIANLERLVPSLAAPSQPSQSKAIARDHTIGEGSRPELRHDKQEDARLVARSYETLRQPTKAYNGPGQYRDSSSLERRNFVPGRGISTSPRKAGAIPFYDDRSDDGWSAGRTYTPTRLEPYDRAPPAYRRESYEILDQHSRRSPIAVDVRRQPAAHEHRSPLPARPTTSAPYAGGKSGNHERNQYHRGESVAARQESGPQPGYYDRKTEYISAWKRSQSERGASSLPALRGSAPRGFRGRGRPMI